jgi:hypothetical protein
MAKEPDQRYPTGLELIDEADRALTTIAAAGATADVETPSTYPETVAEAAIETRAAGTTGEVAAETRLESGLAADPAAPPTPPPPPPGAAPPARTERPAWPFVLVGVVLLALVAGGLVLALGGGGSSAKAVEFESATDPGKGPFTDPADVRGGTTISLPRATAGSGSAGSDLVCDRELLIKSLEGQADRVQQFGQAVGAGTTAAAVAGYIRKLDPVTVSRDVRVTNHAFRDGRAAPYQSILAAGSAILVETDGTPAARCHSGSPLRKEAFVAEAKCLKCPPAYRPPPPCRSYGDCYRRYPGAPAVSTRG